MLLQFAGQPLTSGVAYLKIARPQVCTTYFPAHCVGVTNMFPHYNLSPIWRYITNIKSMRSNSMSQKYFRFVKSYKWLNYQISRPAAFSYEYFPERQYYFNFNTNAQMSTTGNVSCSSLPINKKAGYKSAIDMHYIHDYIRPSDDGVRGDRSPQACMPSVSDRSR